MLKQYWRWLEFGAALLALTILTLACHAMWPDKDGVAAWFQAVGSVAGIGIAIYVPWRQGADRVKRDRVEKLDHRLVIARRLRGITSEFVVVCSELDNQRKEFLRVADMVNVMNINGEGLSSVFDQTLRLDEADLQPDAVGLGSTIRIQIRRMKIQIEKNHGRSLLGLDPEFEGKCAEWISSAESFDKVASDVLAAAEFAQKRA